MNFSLKTLVILGCGALTREFYYYIKHDNLYDNFIFVDDTPNAKQIFEIDEKVFPIINNWKFDKYYQFIVSVGNPIIKKQLVEKALQAGLTPADTIISSDARAYGSDNKIGKGGLIAPGCILTTNITIGDYVIINLDNTLGHDAILEDYVTCNPGCHISGFVTIKQQSVLGTGTIIRDGIEVGERNIIGAQSAVIKNITDCDSVYGGVPAKRLKDR